MKKVFWLLVLGLALTTTGKVYANTGVVDQRETEAVPEEVLGESTNAGFRQAKWLCESVPTWGPGYYWWLSYNYALSYRNATWACQSRHGRCYTACRVVF